MREGAFSLAVFLLTVLSIFAYMTVPGDVRSEITGLAAHGAYTGFAEPLGSYSIGSRDIVFSSASDSGQLSVSASDFAVYKYGYASLDGSGWQRFELSGNTLGGDWLNGSVSAEIPMEASDFGLSDERLSAEMNFVVLYSCSRISGSWDCHDGWQIWQFNASMNAPAAIEISGMTPQSANSYEVSYNGLAEGGLAYTDRTYTFTSVPEAFGAATYIKTPNDDKTLTGYPLVSFSVNVAADLYIAFDDRTIPIPSWLSGWEDTGQSLVIDGLPFEIFSKSFPAGTVILGPSGDAYASMYSIIVMPSGSCPACNGPGGGSADDLTAEELAGVEWHRGPDVTDWAMTSELTSVTFGSNDEICTYHSKAGKWPAYRPYEDFSQLAEANPWIFVNIGGQWNACPYKWYYSGMQCRTGQTVSEITASCDLTGVWNPTEGEEVCFMVTTIARNFVQTSSTDVDGRPYDHENQRSNIKCVGWSTGDECLLNDHSQCDSLTGDVYWYDSCNVKGDIRYDCSPTQTCSGGECRDSPVTGSLPLKVGSSGRYLTYQNGTPFFMNGDTAWSLIAEVSRPDADYYLQSRTGSGFNTILANLIESKYASNAPADYYGDAPFTGKAFTTPNEAYFAHADYVIDSAREKGLIVLLGPLYLDTDEGWGDEVMAASESDMLYWGRYLGNRYRDYDNIIWVIGGDIDPSFADAKAMKVVEGIKEYIPDALFTSHTTNEKMAVDYWSDPSWLNVNDIYSYGNGVPGVASTAYHYTPTKPFFMFESVYENEHLATGVQLRSQAYWTVLSGGFGNVFGNCPMWNFDATTATHYCGSADWKGLLNTEGTQSMSHFKDLFESRSWQLLVPDFSHSVLKSGYGTMGQSDYATAARASDGSTIIAYIPTQRTVTVDTTVLSGSSARTWWYNPRDGTYTDEGTNADSSSQSFTTPTNSGPDWVLVLDEASAGYGPPGT